MSSPGINSTTGISLQTVQRLPMLQPQQHQAVGGLIHSTSAAGGVIQSAAAAAVQSTNTTSAGVIKSTPAIQPTAMMMGDGGGVLQPVAAAAGSPQKANVVVGIQPLGQNTVSYKVISFFFFLAAAFMWSELIQTRYGRSRYWLT